jgi:hypothetical protein
MTLRFSSGGESRIHVRKNRKDVIEPRHFQDRTLRFLQTSEREFAAVRFNRLN